MADMRGGYQLPAKPAMQSGPGRLSQRTDGGPASKQAARYIAGGNYGDGGLMSIQQGAPMAASPGTPSVPQGQVAQAVQQGPQPVPLTEPSQRPNEPVTAGAAAGPGPGPSILGLPPTPTGGTNARMAIQTLAAHPDASPDLIRLANLMGR
jgi:hypothetical protein